jgi:dUTP pyrophosphatase
MTAMRLEVVMIDSGLPLPSYAHDGDAGMDLYAASPVVIQPFQRVLIATGIAVAIPEGFAGFVQPRSGMALRTGLSFVNTPGLIDSHYRGEIGVIAVNLDPSEPIVISRGDRIAQLVIQPVVRCEPVAVAELSGTARGEGGFGSTGL